MRKRGAVILLGGVLALTAAFTAYAYWTERLSVRCELPVCYPVEILHKEAESTAAALPEEMTARFEESEGAEREVSESGRQEAEGKEAEPEGEGDTERKEKTAENETASERKEKAAEKETISEKKERGAEDGAESDGKSMERDGGDQSSEKREEGDGDRTEATHA